MGRVVVKDGQVIACGEAVAVQNVPGDPLNCCEGGPGDQCFAFCDVISPCTNCVDIAFSVNADFEGSNEPISTSGSGTAVVPSIPLIDYYIANQSNNPDFEFDIRFQCTTEIDGVPHWNCGIVASNSSGCPVLFSFISADPAINPSEGGTCPADATWVFLHAQILSQFSCGGGESIASASGSMATTGVECAGASFCDDDMQTGACCLPDGTCVNTTEQQCLNQGGEYQGDDTQCSDVDCEKTTGACCLPTGGCSNTTLSQCQAIGGVFQGLGTDCAEAVCPPPSLGACCVQQPAPVQCIDGITEEQCDGEWFGGLSCDQAPCGPEIQACCIGTSCVETTPTNCFAQGGMPVPGLQCGEFVCDPNDLICCCCGGDCFFTPIGNCTGPDCSVSVIDDCGG